VNEITSNSDKFGKTYLDNYDKVFIDGKDFVKPHALCEVCRKFCRKLGFLQTLLHGRPFRKPRLRYKAPNHYRTPEELDTSASDGCHMCTLILHQLRRSYGDFKYQFSTCPAQSSFARLLLNGDSIGEFALYPLPTENPQCRSCPGLYPTPY
jgi:hypothetical protein